jgi:hypothetical protein
MTKAAELAKMGEVLTNSQIGGRRNIIINGAMQVAQRATSATGLGSANDYAVVDRFRFNFSNTAGRFTASQVASGLSGFGNALKLDCTTADTSIASNEFGVVQYNIEGQDLQQFKKGTSDAEKYTLSFYVKGTAKTYAVELFDGDNNRHVSSLFNVTTSWNRISITFPADTTGAYDDDNATSLSINFALHMGSDTTSGTLQTTWGALSATARYAGIDSFFSSTDNEFFLTGVQLEVGSQATPFEHRSFGEELALCQRYFFRSGKGDSPYAALAQGWATSSINGIGHVAFPCEMRAEPSFSFLHLQASDDANAGLDITACITNNATGNRMYGYLEWTVSSGATQYRGYAIRGQNNSSAFIAYDAEL